MTFPPQVNVKGLNSPNKRSQVFAKWIKQKADITCLQETHIKKRCRFIETTKIGPFICTCKFNRKKERDSGIHKRKSGFKISRSGYWWQMDLCGSKNKWQNFNNHYICSKR